MSRFIVKSNIEGFQMKKFASCLFGALLVACASVPLEERNATLLLAKSAGKEGPTGISDTFTYEGRIFAYLTLRWDDIDKVGGAHELEARWYSGEKIVAKQTYTYQIGKPPFHAWTSVQGTTIGAGNGRVDIHADGRFLASKRFTVVEK